VDLLLISTVAVTVTVFFGAVYVGNGVLKARENTSRRLASLQPTRSEVLDSGFNERAIAPVVQKFGRFAMRFTPQGWAQRTNQRLTVAGWYPRIDANSWAAIRVMVVVGTIVLIAAVAGLLPAGQKVLLSLFILALGILGPDSVLTRRVDDRKKAIERDLPDVIDLLVISVEAGLGFEAALGRVVQNVPGDLSDEFSRMLQETRVGVSRNEAMKKLAERTNVDDLNSFILSINQADQFGVSIARMLRVQADELRVRRRQRAQERAFGAPVKMVFPLVFCIFPGLFVVLLGPAAIKIFDTLLS
jgi:tight adherence protein C